MSLSALELPWARAAAGNALLAGIELGLFAALAEGPAGLEAVVARLALQGRGARDMLDALVALDVLEREGGVYRNGAEAARALNPALPSYAGAALLASNARDFGCWGALPEALRTGQRQNGNDAGGLFASLYADPEGLAAFLAAMSALSARAVPEIAAGFDWARRRSVVDVGTAQGLLPATLARAHPHLACIGFDLPAVGPVFDAFVAAQGVADRVRFHAGDFFGDALPMADVVVLGHVLHNWNLVQKRLLLGRAHKALPPGGAVIVYEALIDEDRRENAFALLMSLHMLLVTDGGFDFTGSDCAGWMRDAGFTDVRGQALVGPHAMVVGVKPSA